MTTTRDLVRPDVRALRPYDEEATSGLDLMSNTNLFGPNPALERALAKMRVDRFHEYPSLTSATMRGAVASKLGVGASMVVTGNGSNDLIDIVCRTFLQPGDRVAYHPPTFGMIPYFARLAQGRPVAAPLGPDWSLDPDALLAAGGKLTFIVRPNNPTGNAFPRKDVERVIEEAPGAVVVDEAYVEFLGGESFVKEIRDGRENVLVLRTLSKAHGLAALRIGYVVAHPAIAEELTKARGPFRLDHLAETVACHALADERYVNETSAAVRAERPNLKRLLEDRGFQVHRSDANFVLARSPVDARGLAAALAERAVHVRWMGPDLPQLLRITVGPPAVTARLRIALDDALARLTGVRA